MKLKLKDAPISGRDNEIANLKKLLDGCGTQATVAVVSGKAGAGKSALIESHRETWALHMNHHFASGKFDPNCSSQPFSATSEAFVELVDSYLETDEGIKELQNFSPTIRLDEEVLRRTVPRLAEYVKKSQARLQRQNSNNSSNSQLGGIKDDSFGSISRVAGEFLSFICKPSRPVVLFLDDIQWADQVTLEFLNRLSNLEEDCKGLLLVLTYREEEGNKESLTEAIKTFEQSEWLIRRLHIKDLDVDSVNTIVSSVTKRDSEQTKRLSQIIHRKAGGNSFYVLQFLQLLQNEQFLFYSFEAYRWEWGDVDTIERSMNVSDDVADLLVSSMRRLEEKTIHVLMVSSCLGTAVPLDVLTEFFSDQTQNASKKRDDNDLKKILSVNPNDLEEIMNSAVAADILGQPKASKPYIWLHDKLQQAAYSMIPDNVRGSLHFRLGSLLQRMGSSDESQEWIVYMAADQLNKYYELESDTTPSVDFAELNLRAAHISISKSAFYPAVELLRSASRCLDVDTRWKENYCLTLDVLSALAENELRLGHLDEAMNVVNEIIENAHTLEDKFIAHCTKTRCTAELQMGGGYERVAEVALEVLAQYNIRIPLKPGYISLLIERWRFRSSFPRGKLDKLLDMPNMEAHDQLRLVTFINRNLSISGVVDYNSLPLVWLANVRVLRVCSVHGVVPSTALGVMVLALTSKVLGNVEEACDRIDVAVKLLGRYDESHVHGMVKATAYAVIYPLKRPFHESLEQMLEASRIGLRTGDLTLSSLSAGAYCCCYLTIGLPIQPLESDIMSFAKDIRRFRQPRIIAVLFHLLLQMVLNLQGKSDKLIDLHDSDMMIEKLKERRPRQIAIRDHCMFRLCLACVFRDFERAAIFMDELLSISGISTMTIFEDHIRNTYVGLAAIALGRDSGRKKWLIRGRMIVKHFKSQVKNGCVNAHPVLLMLQAELKPSKELFDKAIKSCARSGLTHYEAYMNESAGLYFINNVQDPEWAEFYLHRAMERYDNWGATKKVALMKEQYDFLYSSKQCRSVNSSLKGRSRYSGGFQDAVTRLKRFSITDRKHG